MVRIIIILGVSPVTRKHAMYVCLCNALRQQDVDHVIAKGHRTTDEVYAALGVEPQCGSCICDIEMRISDMLVERAA